MRGKCLFNPGLVFIIGIIFVPHPVKACGGVTATIAEDPKSLGTRIAQGPGGIPLYFDTTGNVYVAKKEIKIKSALAEAIAKRYLERKFGTYSHLEFEGFVYEHGDLVYMYHAHVPDLAYSVHVGPVKYVSEHAHIHVSATTGDVYGPGCGLGSGIVEMPFEPEAYPKALRTKHLPYVQFNTPFIAKEGRPPTIDGRIDPEEWQDAAYKVIHLGTTRKTVVEYGWGGEGRAVAHHPERYSVRVWAKIHQGTIYFAVRADTSNWIALLFKDFPHHGMIGDFNDAKLLTVDGVADFFVAEEPGQTEPGPRKLQGVHTWMAYGDLVRDPQPNLIKSAHRTVKEGREYEFAFPLMNKSLGDTAWKQDRSYRIAVLVGPTEVFQGVNEEVFMSDQILIRIGNPSSDSIYHPPLRGVSTGKRKRNLWALAFYVASLNTGLLSEEQHREEAAGRMVLRMHGGRGGMMHRMPMRPSMPMIRIRMSELLSEGRLKGLDCLKKL